jgi:hypothetical protein
MLLTPIATNAAAQQNHLEVKDVLFVVVVKQQSCIRERKGVAEDRLGARTRGEHQGHEVEQRLRNEGFTSWNIGAPGEVEVGGDEGCERRGVGAPGEVEVGGDEGCERGVAHAGT